MTLEFDDLPKVRSPRTQVEAALSELIKQVPPGGQLPPEPTLAKQLGVSRPTLREVLRTFAERGLLVRRHGVGTFVASRLPILETGLEVLESLGRMAQRLALKTEVSYLAVAQRLATDDELAWLELTEMTEVLVVDRVIEIEGEPVADLRDVVPVSYLCQADLGDQFRGSVLDLFLTRGEPVLSISRTEMLVELASASQARRLAISPGSALLKLVAQLFSYDEHIVDYSVSTFVPGHFRFHVMRHVRA
jgi:GntR family transcriptional regulator